MDRCYQSCFSCVVFGKICHIAVLISDAMYCCVSDAPPHSNETCRQWEEKWWAQWYGRQWLCSVFLFLHDLNIFSSVFFFFFRFATAVDLVFCNIWHYGACCYWMLWNMWNSAQPLKTKTKEKEKKTSVLSQGPLMLVKWRILLCHHLCSVVVFIFELLRLIFSVVHIQKHVYVPLKQKS